MKAAAVLVPMFGHPERPGLIFTKRHHDLRHHGGEISFPGGRQDHPDEDLRLTALREAEEEIGLDPAQVEIVDSLPPISTFVTNYLIHPFVGLIPTGLAFRPSPREVDRILELDLRELAAGYAKRRLVRRGVPIRTDTYVVGETVIWGATARILGELLARLDGLPQR